MRVPTLLLLGVSTDCIAVDPATSIPRHYAASLVARMWQFHTMILLVTAIAGGATSLKEDRMKNVLRNYN